MYKIILADDEKWSLYGLEQLVDWKTYDCVILDTVQDGISAFEKCKALKPDILISDIRMPGMDGLELVRKLKQEIPEVTTILITGYSDLAYAQEALRLGVFDYLIKQVTAKDLDKVLNRYQAYMQQKKVLSTSDLYFSLFDDGNDKSVLECMRQLGIDVPYNRCHVITFVFPQNVNIVSAQTFHTDTDMNVVFHTGTNRLSSFCFSDTYLGYESLQRSLNLGAPKAIGLSESVALKEGFYDLYRQSCISASTAMFWKSSAIYCYQSAKRTSAISEFVESLRQSIKHGDSHLIRNALEELFEAMRNMQVDEVEFLVNQVIALLTSYHIGAYENGDYSESLRLNNTDITAESLFPSILASICSCEKNTEDNQNLIARVLEYIDVHFTEDIQSSELARMFFVNPSYLSTLIKKKTGFNYTDIVINKRIDYAKILLKDTSLPLLDIIQKTGYQEYSYFNKLFKKVTGLTPTQYRSKFHC